MSDRRRRAAPRAGRKPPARKDRKGRAIPVYRERGDGGRQFGRPLDVLLIYPQPYPVAMSNLGFLFVYRRLREFPEVNVERAFIAADGTLTPSVESGRDWRAFTVLALACAYLPDLLRFARWAREAGLELDAAARAGRPWLLAGGSGTQVNPRLLAGVADCHVPGRWEDSEAQVRDWLRARLGLPAADSLPAMTVHNTLFTPDAVLADMLLLELQCGCGFRCPFCWYAHAQPSSPPLPARQALALADRYPDAAAVGLISASLADYPELPELLAGLRARGKRVGFASLRLDRLTPELIGLLTDCGMQTLTVAPESGAARWKRAVGKPWTVATLLACLLTAARSGIRRAKLYYLYGFPGETPDELSATGEEIAALAGGLREGGLPVSLEVTMNPLTPQPGTPWEVAPLPTAAQDRAARRALDPVFRAAGVAVEWGSRREAERQYRLSRSTENLARLP